MKFEVLIDAPATSDLRGLRAYDRKAILTTIESVLSVSPTQVSRSRIKRLRGTTAPQYRLRVGEFRVFYDVEGPRVFVTRVLSKAAATEYLKELGHEVQDDQR